MIKIYLGIPSTGTRDDGQVIALENIKKRYAGKVEFVYPPVCVLRIFHDFARNAIVEEFLKSDCDILWFLDSDIVPPIDVLDIVVDHSDKWQLAGAPYPVFMIPPGYESPQIVFTVYDKNEKGFFTKEVPQDGTEFVAGLATGCIFIKKEVFKDLVKPYFEFEYNKETREMTLGEDLGFCKKISELGYKFFVDYSKPCEHRKKVGLLQLNNYAIERSNNSVVAFHRALKQELAKAALNKKPKSSLILP